MAEQLTNQLSAAQSELQGLELVEFSEESAWVLGNHLRQLALADEMPIVIDIRHIDTPIFSLMLPGATAANFDWARRKRNLTLLLGKSSWEISLETKLGTDYLATMGLDPRDYAPHGGCVPIYVSGSSFPVATITISGLPQQQDHELAVKGLRLLKESQQ